MGTPCLLVVVSDRAARGERPDATASLLGPVLAAAGFDLGPVAVVPDERSAIADALRRACAEATLVLTTGGTGVGLRDVVELEIPGLGEEMRRQGARTHPLALGSRGLAGARGRAIVVNLPGRPEGAIECSRAVSSVLPHLLALRQGPVPDAAHRPPAPGG